MHRFCVYCLFIPYTNLHWCEDGPKHSLPVEGRLGSVLRDQVSATCHVAEDCLKHV